MGFVSNNGFYYVTDNDSSLHYRKSLGAGGYGSVHEVYDNSEQKVGYELFARKVLHLPSREPELVQKEVQAIEKLCRPGTHVNIVQVLNHGLLSNYPYYFIDMELCDLNLHDFIHRVGPREPLESLPYFAEGENSVLQIWKIMSQIASGVEYIHSQGQVHRDIKPGNGTSLTFKLNAVWKVGDFGLSTEGSSKSNQPTQYARGTPGYRAPELIVSEGTPTYNNKVDIWSMGCVLYELATGNRAFNNDWVVVEHRYEKKNKEVILNDTFVTDSKEIITKYIVNMLQIEASDRPSAAFLSKQFSRFCSNISNEISSDSVLTIHETRRYPPTPPLSQEVESENDKAQSRLLGQQLYRAAERGDVDAVTTLLNGKADVNVKGGPFGNALQAASDNGHEMIVRLLLENGANVNARGGFYGNALQAASDSGHETIVQLLLENGADVNAKGGQYGTALQAASDSGYESVVRLLLDKGANVNAIGGQYGSALQAASDSGHEKVIRLLLEKGADVNAKGGQYGFALQAASHSGHTSVVQLLLENGADINAEGGVSGNAVQAASVSGHDDVIQLLLERGAKFQSELD